MTSSDQRYILHVHQGDSALPVLCPVLHPLGGHRLSNPTPRRELSSTEEEQHIFGESWLHWWSWMKPAACGMFKVARTGDAKLPPWTYMQDHILWTNMMLPFRWKALMVFPFDQDPAMGLPEEKSGREKIPPHFRRPIECSCKRGILISRHLGAVVISITSQPPHLHCAVTISH